MGGGEWASILELNGVLNRSQCGGWRRGHDCTAAVAETVRVDDESRSEGKDASGKDLCFDIHHEALTDLSTLQGDSRVQLVREGKSLCQIVHIHG